MITVIIPRTEEPKVVMYTQENLIKELYPIPDAEILIEDSWWQGLQKVKTPFVCLVEPDCVVSSGYFASNVGLFQKNPYYRKLAMVSSAVGVRNFANRVFNYELQQTDWEGFEDDVQTKSWFIGANKDKHSTKLCPVQVGFVPGAVIRTSALLENMDEFAKLPLKNLVEFSTRVSFKFWETGRRVEVNPNSTYVSNEGYLDNPPPFEPKVPNGVDNQFKKEGI